MRADEHLLCGAPQPASLVPVAGGIADPLTSDPRDGTRTLRIIRESGGRAVSVDDGEISECMKALAEQEGILAEAAAATSVAAARRMVRNGDVRPGESVVCVVTGHGLKDLASFPG